MSLVGPQRSSENPTSPVYSASSSNSRGNGGIPSNNSGTNLDQSNREGGGSSSNGGIGNNGSSSNGVSGNSSDNSSSTATSTTTTHHFIRRRSSRHRNYMSRAQLHDAVELPDGYGEYLFWQLFILYFLYDLPLYCLLEFFIANLFVGS